MTWGVIIFFAIWVGIAVVFENYVEESRKPKKRSEVRKNDSTRSTMANQDTTTKD